MYGIEQKLKITRHAERYRTASCCDALDVKARTLRRWRRLYREEGAAALSDGRKGGSGPKGRPVPPEVVSFIRHYRQDPRHLNAGAGIIKPALSGFCERRYAITAIDLYSHIGFAMMFSSKSARSSAGYGSVLIGANTSDTKRQRDGV